MRIPRDRLDGTTVGADAEIRAGQGHGLRQLRTGDGAAGPAATEVNPPVRAPLRRVDAALQLARAETGKEHFTRLREAVAIAVSEEENVRRAGHDDAAARGHEAVGGRQIRGEDGGLVHAPVAIGIGEELDDAEGAFLGGVLVLRVGLHAADLGVEFAGLAEFLDVELAGEVVAVQLAHEHPPALVPADARGRGDERLAGHDLHAKAGRELERSSALLGRARLGRVGGRGDLGGRGEGEE